VEISLKVITARVVDIQNVHEWTKAGVMMRDGTAPGARNVFALMPSNRANQFRLQKRTTTDGTTSGTPGGAAPQISWLRLVRRGSTFTASTSTDGTTFTALGAPTTMAMPASLAVGLAVTSHVPGTTASATFDQVSITTP
jgi:hypothetical protein